MRERYVRHFLQNVIELTDALGTYYVQDCFSDRSALFGVELKTFFDHRQTVQWLRDCIAHDHCGIYNLRSFLVQNAPRRFRVHCMDNHRVMDAVARVIVDYDYPVVVRPWYEPPWCASNAIDVICAIQNGAPPSVMSRSPELDSAAKMLQTEVQKHHPGAALGFQQNLLAVNDIDPNDVDTARSSWDVEKWKQDHQLRLAAQHDAMTLQCPKTWDEPHAIRRTIAYTFGLLALMSKEILKHPIEALITGVIMDFIAMFKHPTAHPNSEQASKSVLGRYYQNKDIDPNDLDTADHPGRAMQWVDSYNKRHLKDKHTIKMKLPPPEDTARILAMMVMVLAARKFGKTVARGSAELTEESAAAAERSAGRTAKTTSGKKGMPEVESPKAIEKLENNAEKEYVSSEKDVGPKKTDLEKKPPEPPKKEKVKTRGTPEEQLSKKALNEPVPLTKKELANVEKWSGNRNKYLKKWREKDLSKYPEETKKLLWGSADRSIRKGMTPDDLAALMKERRGVDILKEDGTPFKHLAKEWPDAEQSIKKTIGDEVRPGKFTGIKGRLKSLESNGLGRSDEAALLREKLGDLSKMLDNYESLQIVH